MVMIEYNELLYMNRQKDEYAYDRLIEKSKVIVIKVYKDMITKYPFCKLYREDIIQELTILVCELVNSYREDHDCAFPTYLNKCLKNKATELVRTYLNSKNRINNYCVDIDDVVAETTANYYTKCVNYGYRYDPKVMFDYQSTLHKIEDYYNKLSLMEKEIFMSYLNGASYKEIADKLSISTKTVDNYLQKQKRRLRIIFHDEKIDYLQ